MQVFLSKTIKIRMENQDLFETIHFIIRSFFAFLKKNKFLSVECLFRFSIIFYTHHVNFQYRFANKVEKDQILSNYQDEEDSADEARPEEEEAGGFNDTTHKCKN